MAVQQPPPLPVKTRGTTGHVVKIVIAPEPDPAVLLGNGCVRINVADHQKYFYYNHAMVTSSGQSSPSDTLDSGTCSDLDGSTPPPLPKKKSSTVVTLNAGEHRRSGSLTSSGAEVETDEDDAGSNISCDSLNNSKTQPEQPQMTSFSKLSESRSMVVEERTYQERSQTVKTTPQTPDLSKNPENVSYDSFYEFHLNERPPGGATAAETAAAAKVAALEADEFAGFKDIREERAPIKSAKGTIRGVKNRVRAGIVTFLNLREDKGYKEKEAGKVVLYSTSMGVIRDTYHECLKVKQILRTLLVKFDDRDVCMSREYQTELRQRLGSQEVLVPQLFVEGQYIGDAETIERLNECGELRRLLKPYQSPDACQVCQVCGGYRLLPCNVCNGSKKSVHRNDFTAEFVALKCMHCDEVGLIKCHAC